MDLLNKNNSKEDQNNFPRKLNDIEKKLLQSVLPENKPGYKKYWEKIKDLNVIGYGNFGKDNLILGNKEAVPEQFGPSSPVFAAGTLKYEDLEIDIIVHEEFENQIEAEIYYSKSERDIKNLTFTDKWNYSDWIPGEKAPGDNSFVREEVLVPGQYVIAIAPKHQRLWVHDYNTGINHLIPVSNYYNHLMIVKGIKNSNAVLKPALLFHELDTFSSKEIISAFLLYNKYLKHINIDYSLFSNEQINNVKKKKILKLFKRG